MPRRARKGAPPDPARRNFEAGYAALRDHPMFAPLAWHVHIQRHAGNLCPAQGWAIVTSTGIIHPHPTRQAEPDEWT